MFEGFIASKFADKMFEKDIFRIIRNHAIFGALIMMIPDLGFGTLFFIGVLWHMYSSVCKKVGISFSEHFWSLVGVGFFVNIVIALAIDVIFSFLFFLEGFIIYFQFYMSGKLFVESVKRLDFGDEVKENSQRELLQTKTPQRTAPIAKETVKQLTAESSDSDKSNLVKLDELLTAGILTEEEYAEQKNKIAPSTIQSAIQTPPQRTKVDAKVENNKIAILQNLKLLLDSEVLTPEEFRKQKQSTLSVASIPWGNNMTPIEILVEMKHLLDANVLTQEDFNFHKKIVLSNEHAKVWSNSIRGTVLMLNILIKSDVLTEEELVEIKDKLAKAAIPLAKGEDEKIITLNNLKLILDAGIITPEVYRKEKQLTLSNKWIPWDKDKSKYEILEEMKSLLDTDILSQEEFDFHKKALLSNNK